MNPREAWARGHASTDGRRELSKILVAYATTEGQTRKIAQAAADCAARLGGEVRLVDLADAPQDFDPGESGVVFIAASLHGGRYQSSARHFAKKHAAILNTRRSAFISVSLSAISGEQGDEEGAERCARRFLDETGWTADETYHAAGALRFSDYDFFKRWIMRQIAKSHGYDASADAEFTDWRALDTFVEGFLSATAQSGEGAAKL